MDATTIVPEQELLGFTREAVEALSRSKDEPEWVREARLRAWETYERLPMPQRTDEEWRRTDFRALKLDRLKPFAGLNGAAEGNGHQSGGAVELLEGEDAVSAGDRNAGVVVQQDAMVVRAELDDDIAAQGVIFTDLDTAVREHAELVQR